MMLTVNIHDAKTRLSKLLALVAQGESFIIANRGRPVAKVAPVDEPEKLTPMRIGFAKGLWPEFSADTWAELDRDVLQMFEDEIDRDGGNVPASVTPR